MGVDAYIFAEQDKKCFYFDRKYNFSYDFGPKDVLTFSDVIAQCERNLVKPDEIGHHALYWNEKIIAFAQRHQTNTFRIISDHDGPDSHDVIERDGYTEES